MIVEAAIKKDSKKNELTDVFVETMYLGSQEIKTSCIENVNCYISDLSKITSNYAGFKSKNVSNFVLKIKATTKILHNRSVPFCWVCEDVREAAVISILNSMKFKKNYSFWGMFHIKEEKLPISTGKLIVEEVDVILLNKHANEIASELHCSSGYVKHSLKHHGYSETEKLRTYAAFTPSGKIAGFALMIEMPDRLFGLLRMGVIFSQYKGFGGYRALYRIRVLDAYLSGLQMVIAHAYEDTAMPILEKFGMHKYKRFTMYGAPA